MSKFLKIHPEDNVFVALADLHEGETIKYGEVSINLVDSIQAKHKFAEKLFEVGDEIKMYGILVGKASQQILPGAALTTENVHHETASYTEKKDALNWTPPDVSKYSSMTFNGYHREDGQVGVANYWLVVPLVFCENRNINVMREAFEDALGFGKVNPYKLYVKELVDILIDGKEDQIKTHSFKAGESKSSAPIFENIDGVQFLTHEGGCGGIRQDSETLCALIAGYINNPNVAGATVLSLGCQNAQPEILRSKLNKLNPDLTKPVYILEQQKEGTEEELLTKAIQKTFIGLTEANKLTRKPAPLSKLKIGLECGGSDGFSGISANPAVGHVSDLLSALGGSSILSEFPELCGVEQELINRTTDNKSAEKFVELMRAYSSAAVAAGSGFDMNPSPGNIKDGLITDAMKSAGAAKKGGTSPINDVLDYGEYVTKPGLNLLCTPGNDVESTTAMAGSGASIILFTTGLGTPTGNPVAPVVKISSNTRLAEKMPDIIDVNAGEVIEGTKTIEQVGEEMFDYIIEVANGNVKTKAMELNQIDFIPWKRGVSL